MAQSATQRCYIVAPQPGSKKHSFLYNQIHKSLHLCCYAGGINKLKTPRIIAATFVRRSQIIKYAYYQ